MDYRIQINGLVSGKHHFSFAITKELFEARENSSVLDADMMADVVLDKGSGWMSVSCNIKGDLFVECDRCLDKLSLPMDITANMAIRQMKIDGSQEESEDCIIIDPSEGEVDLQQFIYDYICVNIPIKKVHKEGECNKEMLKKLEDLKLDTKPAKEDVYSPFERLKELIDNK